MQRRTFVQAIIGTITGIFAKIAFWRKPVPKQLPAVPEDATPVFRSDPVHVKKPYQYLETKHFKQTIVTVAAYDEVQLEAPYFTRWTFNGKMAVPVLEQRTSIDVGYVVGRVLTPAQQRAYTDDTSMKEAMLNAKIPNWHPRLLSPEEREVWTDDIIDQIEDSLVNERYRS